MWSKVDEAVVDFSGNADQQEKEEHSENLGKIWKILTEWRLLWNLENARYGKFGKINRMWGRKKGVENIMRQSIMGDKEKS